MLADTRRLSQSVAALTDLNSNFRAQAANVTSGRVMEKETKSFAFDKSYWCVALSLGRRSLRPSRSA